MRDDLIEACPQGVQHYYLKGLTFLVVSTIAALSMTFLLYSAFSGQLLGGNIEYDTWDQALAKAGFSDVGGDSQSPDDSSRTTPTDTESVDNQGSAIRPGLLILCISLGLLWGYFVILTIDRYLTFTMEGLGRRLRERAQQNAEEPLWRRALGALPRFLSRFFVNLFQALPRLLLASALGLVVSTPLTLQFFRQTIEDQIRQTIETSHAQVVKKFTSSKEVTDVVTATTDLETKPQERALEAREARLEPLRTQLAQADGLVTTAYDQYTTKNNQAIAEANYGSVCNAGTTWGPCAQALYEDAQALKTDYDDKVKTRDLIQDQINNIMNEELVVDNTPEQTALDRASAALQLLNQDLRSEYDRAAGNTGLLAQIEAEWALGGAMGAAHLVFLLIFFGIEILPVTIQFLQNMRTDETLYEELSRLRDAESVGGIEQRLKAEKDEREVWWNEHLVAFKKLAHVQCDAADHMAAKQLINQINANNKIADRYWTHLETAIDNWDSAGPASPSSQVVESKDRVARPAPESEQGGQALPGGSGEEMLS
jgi:hypothetical protein